MRAIWDEKSATDAIINDYMAKFFRNTIERKDGNSKKDKTAANPGRSLEEIDQDRDDALSGSGNLVTGGEQ